MFVSLTFLTNGIRGILFHCLCSKIRWKEISKWFLWRILLSRKNCCNLDDRDIAEKCNVNMSKTFFSKIIVQIKVSIFSF